MATQKIELGEWETALLSGLEHTRSIFTIADAAAELPGLGRQSVRNILSRLTRKGRIVRIKKGTYLRVPFGLKNWSEDHLAIVPIFSKEGYVSFWSALRYWNLTTQLPQVVTIAVTSGSRSEKRFGSISYEFVKVKPSLFFGYEEKKIAEQTVRIATREKAILDSLLHPQYAGGIGEIFGAIKQAKNELDWKRMAEYAGQMDSDVVNRRLRYCLKLLKLGGPLRTLGKFKMGKGLRILDPTRQKTPIRIDGEYRLIVNVDLWREI